MLDIFLEFVSSFLIFATMVSLIWLLFAFFWTPFSLFLENRPRRTVANRLNDFYE